MANRQFGYGGLANTNGIRSFSGKVLSVGGVGGNMPMRQMGHVQAAMRSFRIILFLLTGV